MNILYIPEIQTKLFLYILKRNSLKYEAGIHTQEILQKKVTIENLKYAH